MELMVLSLSTIREHERKSGFDMMWCIKKNSTANSLEEILDYHKTLITDPQTHRPVVCLMLYLAVTKNVYHTKMENCQGGKIFVLGFPEFIFKHEIT